MVQSWHGRLASNDDADVLAVVIVALSHSGRHSLRVTPGDRRDQSRFAVIEAGGIGYRIFSTWHTAAAGAAASHSHDHWRPVCAYGFRRPVARRLITVAIVFSAPAVSARPGGGSGQPVNSGGDFHRRQRRRRGWPLIALSQRGSAGPARSRQEHRSWNGRSVPVPVLDEAREGNARRSASLACACQNVARRTSGATEPQRQYRDASLLSWWTLMSTS